MWDAKRDKKRKEQIEIKIVNCSYLFDYKVSLIVSVYSGGKVEGIITLLNFFLNKLYYLLLSSMAALYLIML